MLGASAAHRQHVDDVLQALTGLRDEVVGLELLLSVPANGAAEVQRATAGGDAVGLAAGGIPTGCVQSFVLCW